MIAILVSWTIIFFILFSFGDIFISIYNKLCKREESYGILDSFFLGLCFILIPLQFTSLWLPSGHYMLFAYIVICMIYWVCKRKRLKKFLVDYSKSFKQITTLQGISIIIVIASVILYCLFLYTFFDAEYYHYQHIRLNEEYPVIPGLGNFEDRFGFNSNYLLLSAIFSFRFIFTDAVYTLQGLIFALLLCWGFTKFILEKHNLNYLVFIILLLTFFLIGERYLDNSSTDSLPFLCVFYYISKTIFKPTWLEKQPLLAYLLPFTLITIKLSTIIFCIASLIILIYLIKSKQFKSVSFLFIASFLIVSLWIIRNVIITGYFVYPIYNVDLFSFDWKMPKIVLMLQKQYIYYYASYAGKYLLFEDVLKTSIDGFNLSLPGRYLQWIIYGLFLLSPIFIFSSIFRKINIHRNIYLIYLASFISLIFIFITAPDFRFAFSYIFGCAFIGFHIIITLFGKQDCNISKYKTAIILSVACCFLIVSYRKKHSIIHHFYTKKKEIFNSVIYTPLFHYESSKYNLQFSEYKLGELTIPMKIGDDIRTFDVAPATNPYGLPYTPFAGGKIQNIKTIEPRGKRLEDGFRTKKEYMDMLNYNTDRYLKEYNSLGSVRNDKE